MSQIPFANTGSSLDVPNPDSDKHYCWLDSHDQRQIMKFVHNGYLPVEGEETANRIFGPTLGKSMCKSNGRIGYKELELFYIPKDKYIAFEEWKYAEHLRRKQVSVDEFEDKMDRFRRHGVSYYSQSREEYEDRKAWDTRDGTPFVTVPASSSTTSVQEKE